MTNSDVSFVRRRRAVGNMAMLYTGKTSGVLVAFFFLPLYSKLLGAEQFGTVAIILSLQSLLIMIDLGMSTLVSRDIASGESVSVGLVKLILTAEISLSGFYLLLLIGSVVMKLMGGLSGLDFITTLAIVTLFWLLVLQNMYYSAMLARLNYIDGTIIQVVGVLIRAIVSWYILANYSATLSTFILTQLAISAAHCLLSRHYLLNLMRSRLSARTVNAKISFNDCFLLLGRGRAILISGIAGAAAMQLDKPIISFFKSTADITPYFFAITFSSMPVSLLATPIVQYFQPKIIADIANRDFISYRKNITNLTIAFVVLTIIPIILLFTLNSLIVNLWLGASAQSNLVSSYSQILLIGYGIATIGYIPYVVIIAKQDYRFQAMLSASAAFLVLLATAISASASSIVYVCYSYVGYFSIVTIGFFIRIVTIKSSSVVI